LGGGSFITIAPLVRAWKEKEDQRYRISQFEIPDKVEEAASLAAKEIWRAASEIASMEIVEAHDAATLCIVREYYVVKLPEYTAGS
jgi:hypothetical protein